MSLNLNNFRTVFDDKFGNDTSLNKSLWSDSWGGPDQFSFSGGALTLSAYEKPWWNPVAIMQKASAGNKSGGEGYGLYQFSGYANAGQGIGICFIMWRADNTFLDSSTPGKATEIDVLESWDGTRTGESTIHYYDTSWKQNNGQSYHKLNVDLTKNHTYAVDWERGSLTYYIDGQEIYQDTTHAPRDYADGGSNEVMGAQLINETSYVTTPTVQLHITEMSYSAPASGGTLPAPAPTIAVSAPGTVQEAKVGAGVTVTETVTTTNLTGSVYEEVLTASGAVESGYAAVKLVNGQAIFSVHLAKSGDVIRVVNNATTPTVATTSSAVTITDPGKSPVPTITVSAPGTVQEASAGAGVTVTETVTTTNLTGNVYAEVLTASGTVESPYQALALSGGHASAAIRFLKSGDTLRVVDRVNAPTVTANSSAITITDVASGKAGLTISKVAMDGSRLLISGNKEVGGTSTLREFVDGKYIGALREGLKDGVFSLHAPNIAAGKHELKLTIDGSKSFALFDFTKTGTKITPAAVQPSTLSSGSASSLLHLVSNSAHTVAAVLTH